MIRRLFLYGAFGGLLMFPGSGCISADSDRVEVVVFAAASLTDVTEALAEAFEEKHRNIDVVVSIGASSTLARQIGSGAPADLFLSASPEWMEYLEARGLLVEGAITLARNHLVVLGKAGATAISEPSELTRFARIAIADPSHVPAGKYAREALTSAGIWEVVDASIIPTLDVRAAVAALDDGLVDAAIVYASDALVAPHLPVTLIWPADLQPSIEISGARLRESTPEAAAFLAFLADPGQQPAWIAYGFDRVQPGREAER